jgi:hypothetical protein
MQKGIAFQVIEETNKACAIKFMRGDLQYLSTFTIEDAKTAGLLTKNNWTKYTKDMLYWRCVVRGLRRICPDAVMGLYTPDEISEGKYINVTEIANETPAKTTQDASDSTNGDIDIAIEAPETKPQENEEAIIADLKKKLNRKMKNLTKEEKISFFRLTIPGDVTVDKLQSFIDHFDECYAAFAMWASNAADNEAIEKSEE